MWTGVTQVTFFVPAFPPGTEYDDYALHSTDGSYWVERTQESQGLKDAVVDGSK